MAAEITYPDNLKSMWTKCISTHGNTRCVEIQGTDLVKYLTNLHGYKGLSAKAFGEAILGALLVASYLKPGERVNLNVQGSGICKQALVDADAEGRVRGYLVENDAWLDIGGVGHWGSGLLSILKTRSDSPGQPYIGTVPLLTGHLAKDLTFYWQQSEQVATANGIFVELNGSGEISSANAFLIQALPGADQVELEAIEKSLESFENVSSSVEPTVNSPLTLVGQVFSHSPFMILEQKRLEFYCQCSWKRVLDALALVGAEELSSMIQSEGKANIRCDFCTYDYQISKVELEALLQKVTPV